MEYKLIYHLFAISFLFLCYAVWLFYTEVLTPRKDFKVWVNEKRKYKGSHKQ